MCIRDRLTVTSLWVSMTISSGFMDFLLDGDGVINL